MSRLRFGIFMAPFHSPPGQNPTLALERDVRTVELLDEQSDALAAWTDKHAKDRANRS